MGSVRSEEEEGLEYLDTTPEMYGIGVIEGRDLYRAPPHWH